jgi:AcrR family transcriptional regulator
VKRVIPSHIVGSPATTLRRPPPRERLLIAAEAVWSDAGYAVARVEDVLRVADVSRATFYQHFAGKEDLAGALLERAVGLLLTTASERSLLGDSFEAKVALALDAYLELWEQHGRIVQELTAEALRPGSSLGPMRKRAVDAPIEPVVVRHLILGIEAELMHARLGKGIARKSELRDQLLALVLATVHSTTATPRRKRR